MTNLQQYLQDREEEYEIKVNKESWGACFECCDFESMIKKTHTFNRETLQTALKMQAEEIYKQVYNQTAGEDSEIALSIIENYK